MISSSTGAIFRSSFSIFCSLGVHANAAITPPSAIIKPISSRRPRLFWRSAFGDFLISIILFFDCYPVGWLVFRHPARAVPTASSNPLRRIYGSLHTTNIERKNQKRIGRRKKSMFFIYFCRRRGGVQTPAGTIRRGGELRPLRTFVFMEYLYGKDMTELRRLCEELSLPRFAAGQIARWLYRRHTTDAAAMTDLPAAARVRLAERCDTGLSAPVGGQHVVRRNEEVSVPYRAGAFHRIGLYPRRRPRHALRLVAGGLPHGLPFLRHRPAGIAAFAHGGRDSQSDRVAARTRPSDQHRFYGYGRAARQPRRRTAGHRSAYGRVGLRLVAHAHHALDGGRHPAAAAAVGHDAGTSGRVAAQPLCRGACGDHADRTGLSDPRAGRRAARLRLHGAAPRVVPNIS